jgi:cell division protein FtsI/penicillin-binding protein 2
MGPDIVTIDRIRRVVTRSGARLARAREPANDWRSTLRRRTLIAAVLLGVWAGGIEVRLLSLQIYQHADLVTRAARQQKRTIVAPAKRGDILDRHGRVLATSVDADSIYAVPSEISNAAETAGRLCEAFGDCTEKERQALTERLGQSRAFAYVRRQVPPDQAHRVAALNLDAVGFIKESRRFYPNKELAAQLLGWAGIDNVGLSGLEYAYDSQIRGKPGTVLIHTDARRHAFSRFERPPTSGSSVELTIDEYLQHIAERELHAGVAENRAAGGSAIIVDPHTGEILAMANEPTFNPNAAYRESQETERRNRAVQDLYEPGSTFKLVTASAAIEEKVMPIDTWIDTNPGQIKIGSRVVRDMKNHGVLSFSDVIVESSNVGAIKIGFKIGTERLSRYVQRFGFGHPVSPDFPGESAGIVWNPDKWTDSALASVSMGYQVGVTPLQMVTAVSSIANRGELVEPRVIRAVYHGNRRYGVHPKIVRRTVSADTAAVLTGIMESVVERGTAKAAQIPGYTIAGKTGTATKLVNGNYSNSDYNASFVGFLPSHTPAVAIIVVIDSPHAGPYTGGLISAPIFRRIAEATLRHLGIGPTLNPAPPVIVARHDEASGVQTAAPETAGPVVSFVTDGAPPAMPDLSGMSAREAMRKLTTVGLTARISGDGFVVSQDPPAGARLEPGGVSRVTLERSPARQPSGVAQP